MRVCVSKRCTAGDKFLHAFCVHCTALSMSQRGRAAWIGARPPLMLKAKKNNPTNCQLSVPVFANHTGSHINKAREPFRERKWFYEYASATESISKRPRSCLRVI